MSGQPNFPARQTSAGETMAKTPDKGPDMTLTARILSSALILLFCHFPALTRAGGQANPIEQAIKDRKVMEVVIKTENNPLDIAMTEDAGIVYVTHHFPGKISEIKENKVTRTVEVGKNLTGIALTRDEKLLYVGVGGEDYVALVDAKTLKVLKKIPTGKWPLGVRISDDGQFVAVCCYLSNRVDLISTTTHEVKSVPVGTYPFYVAISRDSKRVYATNYGSHNLSVIEVEKNQGELRAKDFFPRVVKTIPVGQGPVGVALTADGKAVYTANYSEASVTVISTKRLVPLQTIQVGVNPYFIGASPENSFVMVSNYGSNHVDVIYQDNKRTTIEVKNATTNIYVSPNGKRVFTSNYNNAFVGVIE
jgi:YVTN family beta-propeller protein